VEASRSALRAAGLQADDIDLIIVATSTPDYVLPEHGLPPSGEARREGFAPRSTCRRYAAAFVYGLATADSFIRSGQYKKALVVGAEVFLANPRLERSRHLRAFSATAQAP